MYFPLESKTMKSRWSESLVLVIMLSFLDVAHANNGTSSETELQPLITTSELVVGQNRFAFGLLKAGTLVQRADVILRVYAITGQETQLASEVKAAFHPIDPPKPSVHRHADGTRHVHGARDSDVAGIYVTQLAFSHAGQWGVELVARDGNDAGESVRFAVAVANSATTPAVGAPAPRSRNLVAADVKDLRQIDTSPTPDKRLHQTRIVDAIRLGKPQLIVFATPQFCTSRMCGPVVEIVKGLLPAYGKKVAFTHQEIWQDFAAKRPFPTVTEWQLSSEPWVFLVDGRGIIRAKFEGLVTARELETALQEILAADPSRR
jgi:hypothetical protein